MLSTRVSEAPIIWRCLNGIVNIFKPAGVSVSCVKSSILGNLCKDLNQLVVRPLEKQILIENIETDKYAVKTVTDLSDHILAVGPRYQIEDFKIVRALPSSVIGLNGGTKQVHRMRQQQLPRIYHVTGLFGAATETHFAGSMVVARATYRHIWIDKLNALLSSMQASHQKKMFALCGVDLQSQTAYDLAVNGLIRPTDTMIPVLYGIKCIKFEKPEFTLEISTLNESEGYLGELVHEIGLQMHSVAYCMGIRCIRDGGFYVNDSLLRHQWTLENVMTNISLCRGIIE